MGGDSIKVSELHRELKVVDLSNLPAFKAKVSTLHEFNHSRVQNSQTKLTPRYVSVCNAHCYVI